ncbi:hypothetical protein CR513_25993, partial [Mucuna pruriens]
MQREKISIKLIGQLNKQINKVQLNAKVKYLITYALSKSEDDRTNQVRKTKISMLVHQPKMLKMVKSETIEEIMLTTKQKAKDLSTLKLNKLLGFLRIHELKMKDTNSKKEEKIITLKKKSTS